MRRDEPPNPSPARVRAARRAGEAMRLTARGLPAHEIARRFNYRSAVAAAGAVERARDQVFPFDVADAILIERRLMQCLADAVVRSMSIGASADQLDRAARLLIRSCHIELRVRDAIRSLGQAELDLAWIDFAAVDLGEWTEALSMRSLGRSFHEIADELGLDDFFDANQIVFTDLVRYQQGCAVALRARQVAELSQQLRDVWEPATRTPPVDFRAASRAMSILDRRWRVRGIGLAFRGPLIDHAAAVHR